MAGGRAEGGSQGGDQRLLVGGDCQKGDAAMRKTHGITCIWTEHLWTNPVKDGVSINMKSEVQSAKENDLEMFQDLSVEFGIPEMQLQVQPKQ